jgi:hypothetical protein
MLRSSRDSSPGHVSGGATGRMFSAWYQLSTSIVSA